METKVNPGAGYRLLETGETIKHGDEYHNLGVKWCPTIQVFDDTKVDGVLTYRRRITPKPPLGLKPRKLHDEDRLNEVRSAIRRYVVARLDVPAEWLTEYFELTNTEFMMGL